MAWLHGLKRQAGHHEMTPPILMPTAPRYLPLAQWTCAQINKFWVGHPRVYICGAEGDERALPMRDDPQDWMRVVATACADLLADGCRQVYVILDDHPPIAQCHKEHLETALPRMAEELGANVLYGGHYATETFGVKALAACLSAKFRLPWSFLDHPTGL